MMDARRFLRLKEKIAELRKEKDRAEGALQRILEEIGEKCGARTLKEARTCLGRLRRRRDEARGNFRDALRQFEERWRDDLE